MSEKVRILKVAGVFIAIILGAGFASGQELLSFFVKYGNIGLVGLFVSGFLFFVCGWAVLSICFTRKIGSYSEFIKYVFGEMGGTIIETVVICFMFVIFSTMLAGGGSALENSFNFPFTAGVLLIAALCFVTFLFDLDGLVEINSFLAPVLFFGGIFVGLYTYFNHSVGAFSSSQFSISNVSWLGSAVIYSAYNMITAVSVLASLSSLVSTKKVSFFGALLGSGVVTLMGVCLSLPLLVNYFDINTAQIPILEITAKHGFLLEYFYFLILMIAIYTTAIANGFAILQSFVKVKLFKRHSILFKLILCVFASIFAHVGFSNFVSLVYPIFGYFGLVEIAFIIFALGKSKSLAYIKKK